MKFHTGDRVRVKSFEEISLTLDSNGYVDRLFFNPRMKAYCGQIFIVDGYNYRDNILLKRVVRKENGSRWCWDESWLEPARKTFSDIILRRD